VYFSDFIFLLESFFSRVVCRGLERRWVFCWLWAIVWCCVCIILVWIYSYIFSVGYSGVIVILDIWVLVIMNRCSYIFI